MDNNVYKAIDVEVDLVRYLKTKTNTRVAVFDTDPIEVKPETQILIQLTNTTTSQHAMIRTNTVSFFIYSTDLATASNLARDVEAWVQLAPVSMDSKCWSSTITSGAVRIDTPQREACYTYSVTADLTYKSTVIN